MKTKHKITHTAKNYKTQQINDSFLMFDLGVKVVFKFMCLWFGLRYTCFAFLATVDKTIYDGGKGKKRRACKMYNLFLKTRLNTKQTSLKQNQQSPLQNQQTPMQNRLLMQNHQSCTELSIDGVQRGITRNRILGNT